MIIETTPRYTRVAIILHWVVALLVITNLVITWFWDHLPKPLSMPVANTHKTFGILVLGLALLRILWRVSHPPRPADLDKPLGYRRAVGALYILFYVLIVAMPLTGWIYDSAWTKAAANPINFWGLFEMPRLPWVTSWSVEQKETTGELFGKIHEALGYALYVLIALHLLGAVKAQWKEKRPVMQRMTLRGALRE
ncbi:MAG: cytochrome b [Steroidobacteraceae bacterium]